MSDNDNSDTQHSDEIPADVQGDPDASEQETYAAEADGLEAELAKTKDQLLRTIAESDMHAVCMAAGWQESERLLNGTWRDYCSCKYTCMHEVLLASHFPLADQTHIQNCYLLYEVSQR